MRLTPDQVAAILDIAHSSVEAGAQVAVYGSRTDDHARGGDLDLVIQHQRPLDGLQKARVRMQLEHAVGLPVDLLFVQHGRRMTPFERLATARAQPLEWEAVR